MVEMSQKSSNIKMTWDVGNWMWRITPFFLCMTFTGEKDGLVKCQTLCSKMNAQEEQKIKIKISFMTVVFSGEPEGFRFPTAECRRGSSDAFPWNIVFWENLWVQHSASSARFYWVIRINLLSWRGKIGDSYSCFREGKPLDLGVKFRTAERTKWNFFLHGKLRYQP